MKTFIALSLFVAVASAGIIRAKEQLHTVAAFGKLEGRITNGEIAAPGQFPYQVGLDLFFEDGGQTCGGTLISDQWILTAAQCSYNAESGLVFLGAFLKGDIQEEGQKIIAIYSENIFVHENFNPKEADDDISLIKLPDVIEFNEFIQPAALPSKNEISKTYEGELVVASGWGWDSDCTIFDFPFLQYIEVPVMKQSTCKETFTFVTDEMLCVSTKGNKSHCHGDVGGPLVLANDAVNTLVGIATYPYYRGCTKGYPGLFTRVTEYLDWIEDVTGVANI